MRKPKSKNALQEILLETLAEFYQGVIKEEMASKGDLADLATKKDLERFATKEDLGVIEARISELSGEIKKNNRLITNVEIALVDKVKDHETRIQLLEKFQAQLNP